MSYGVWKDNIKRSLKRVLSGVCFFLYTIIAGGISIVYMLAMALWNRLKAHKMAVIVTALITETVVSGISFAQMRARVVNAEWQRDRLAIKLDSVMELDGRKPSYSRLEAYNAEKDNVIK